MTLLIGIATAVANLFGISVFRLLVIAGTVVAVITAGLAYRQSLIWKGEAIEKAKIEQQNQRAKTNADRAAASPDECDASGGVWDLISARCQRP